VPRYYQELYTNASIGLPRRKTLDKSIDPVAWVPFFGLKSPYEPFADNKTRELRRHYYAAISWADFVAGQVFAEVERLNLSDSTAIIVHADHGWHLGVCTLRQRLFDASSFLCFAGHPLCQKQLLWMCFVLQSSVFESRMG